MPSNSPSFGVSKPLVGSKKTRVMEISTKWGPVNNSGFPSIQYRQNARMVGFSTSPGQHTKGRRRSCLKASQNKMLDIPCTCMCIYRYSDTGICVYIWIHTTTKVNMGKVFQTLFFRGASKQFVSGRKKAVGWRYDLEITKVSTITSGHVKINLK